MLVYGADPQKDGGKVWWNENNPRMRSIWGTQEDYDRHVQQGGTWDEYKTLAESRMSSSGEFVSTYNHDEFSSNKRVR